MENRGKLLASVPYRPASKRFLPIQWWGAKEITLHDGTREKIEDVDIYLTDKGKYLLVAPSFEEERDLSDLPGAVVDVLRRAGG